MASRNEHLDNLVSEPREALDVEVKQWLDLTDNDHRAVLAKEVIALANHGGGYIVIGFEQLTDGSFRAAASRPANLEAWSPDAIQSIIAKYVEPTIQCTVVHQSASSPDNRYPIIIVPGGHRVPVRAKSGSPDGKKLVPHRVYIRRAGPNSEEPKTAEEWDRFLERCVQNRQTELLEAMRAIMAGIIPTSDHKAPSRIDQLRAFEEDAIRRWEKRAAHLPSDVPPRFPHGHYDFSAVIDGTIERQPLSELRDTISTSVRNHSGWPPFLTLSRAPFAPKPIDGAIEFWCGPDNDGSYDKPAHHDFWRIAPAGQFFTRRGYQEDGGYKGMEPGKFFDITSPTWRLGEAILEVAYIARALKAVDVNFICHCRWQNLSGRRLVSHGNPDRMVMDTWHAQQDSYEALETVALAALPAALPELVYAVLAPLYELFDFYRLPKRLVEEELASLQKRVFR